MFLNLTCKIIYIHGTDSINKMNFSRLVAIKELTNMTLIEIPNVGHWPMLEDPKKFQSIIELYL